MLLGSAALLVLVVVQHHAALQSLRRMGVEFGSQGSIAPLLAIPVSFAAVGGYAIVKRHEASALLAGAFALATAALPWLAQQASRGG
jgi:hypothetical protein